VTTAVLRGADADQGSPAMTATKKAAAPTGGKLPPLEI